MLQTRNLRHRAAIAMGALAALSAPQASAQSLFGQSSLGDGKSQIRVDARMHTSSGSCAFCDFSQKSMTRLRLRDADFSNSNFYRSNLSGGHFDGTDLSGAVFSKAYLVKTEGTRVNLEGAVLRDATLIQATLTESRFAGADLRRADLSEGDFTASDFSRADLSSSNARGADFTDAVMREARLPMANLDGATLARADFTAARAVDISLADADLTDAVLAGADLRSARGLTQGQLDTACGDAQTRLPASLTVTYCDPSVTSQLERASGDHDHTQAMLRLDSAIRDLEGMMQSPTLDRTERRALERVHNQLVGSRRALSQ